MKFPSPRTDAVCSVEGVKFLTLNNEVTMPTLGFGVWRSAPEETAAAVETALRTGYRHIDTAAAYQNEREVGEGIRRSGIDRSEVFVETKVWVTDYGYDKTLHAFDKSLNKLGVDQIDLLILHQPMPQHFEATIDAYRALERLLADGGVRAVGVSNFTPHHLCALAERSTVEPSVNQIELHPYFTQPNVRATNTERGILTQAWSPIGGVTFYHDGDDKRRSVLHDETIGRISAVHEKSPAQIMLRWHIQRGRSAIPKSTNPSRIAENFNVFDFQLSDDELALIEALDSGIRSGPDPDNVDPLSRSIEIPEP
jgi:2,5-diketo-D-gluconate reductase A